MKSTVASVVLFCAGSVRIKGEVVAAIIVADGDVEIEARGEITAVLVIARGNVTVTGLRNSYLTIYAGGEIKIPHPKGIKPYGSVLRENDRTGLGLVKFFETKDAGLEAVADPKGVRLTAVHAKSIFDGRLLTKDVVTAIDKDATPDAEKFRRVLRRALANVGNEVVFHVLRDGKAVKVPVSIPALPATKEAPAKP